MAIATPSAPPPPRRGLARVFAPRRLAAVAIAAAVVSLFIWPGWQSRYVILYGRLLFVGLWMLLSFGVLEVWPARLPRWLARWGLQVMGVAATVPFAAITVYAFMTPSDPPFWEDTLRLTGFGLLNLFGLLVGPWMAVSAVFRQITGAAEHQALTFELTRSELERKAADSQLRLLQARVEPHFLFNTLANVRELVDAGSPQASPVLASLIAYLRAAVPRLEEATSTVERELELVRAYLEVMQMRMPDRLQYVIVADDAARALACPPTTLLTLVENAVRHGIDPSEDGGRIEVRASVRGERLLAQVLDTGVGLAASGRAGSLGTGLTTLRERLALTFGGAENVRVTLVAVEPRGTCAEVELPARRDGGA
ncbi:MAG: histidine kinase [Deltaproteobacteria bacterium]|nr:histidine kinase [Deltaproteobacteria bacterium]